MSLLTLLAPPGAPVVGGRPVVPAGAVRYYGNKPWLDWPAKLDTKPFAATDQQAAEWQFRLWQALGERHDILNPDGFWPRVNFPWDEGIIDEISTTSLRDGTKTWYWRTGVGLTADPAPPSIPRWRPGFQTGDPDLWYFPAAYDVIVDADNPDPRLVLRASITGNTLDTLQFADEGWRLNVPDLGALVGKRYRIYATGGLHYGDRWPIAPNCWTYDAGVISAATASTLTDDARTRPKDPNDTAPKRTPWPVNRWQTGDKNDANKPERYEVVYLTSTAPRQYVRALVNSNTADQLTFDAGKGVPVVGSTYFIIEQGGAFWPDQPQSYLHTWYRGVHDGYWSVHPNGKLRTTNVPATQVQVGLTEEGEPIYTNPFDNDYWSALDDEYLKPDTALAQRLYATPRGLQLGIEETIGYFVPARNVSNTVRNYHAQRRWVIRNYNRATFFSDLGADQRLVNIDSFTGGDTAAPKTTAALPDDYVSVGSVAIDWALLDRPAKETAQQSGTGYLGANGQVTITSGSLQLDDVGRRLLITFGWHRAVPREYLHHYDRWQFEPDLKAGLLGGLEAVDPPVSTYLDDSDPPVEVIGTGIWRKLPKCTTYKEHDDLGRVIRGPRKFVNGEYARYAGDNFNDPVMHAEGVSDKYDPDPLTDPDGQDPQTPYLLSSADLILPPAPGGDPRSGLIGAATTVSITAGAAVWWPDGVLVTHTGTATSGSTTQLNDTAKGTDKFFNPTEAERKGRFTDLVLEITSGPMTGQRVPIKKHLGTQLDLLHALPAPITAGTQYRIREPRGGRYRNRYAERFLHVALADGTYREIEITHSDDQWLWFAEQSYTLPVGGRFRIVEAEPGQVFLRRKGAWIKPPITENDPRSAAPHPADQRTILPTIKKRYGRYMKGDYVGHGFYLQLFNGINLLRWTQHDPSWISRGDDNRNQPFVSLILWFDNWVGPYKFGGYADEDEWEATWKDVAARAYAGTTTYDSIDPVGAPSIDSINGVRPLCRSKWQKDRIDHHPAAPDLSGGLFTARVYSYGQVTVPNTRVKAACDWLVWGQIDADDHDAGTVIDGVFREEYEFAANGDPVLYHLWSKWDSTPAAAGATRDTTQKLGSLNAPTNAGDPLNLLPPGPPNTAFAGTPPTTSYVENVTGYQVGDEVVIARWDVSGGLIKVADLHAFTWPY